MIDSKAAGGTGKQKAGGRESQAQAPALRHLRLHVSIHTSWMDEGALDLLAGMHRARLPWRSRLDGPYRGRAESRSSGVEDQSTMCRKQKDLYLYLSMGCQTWQERHPDLELTSGMLGTVSATVALTTTWPMNHPSAAMRLLL